MQAPDFYLVITHYEGLGLGSPDVSDDPDAAIDQLAECLCEGREARAFLIQFDVETNVVETISEVTDRFLETINRRAALPAKKLPQGRASLASGSDSDTETHGTPAGHFFFDFSGLTAFPNAGDNAGGAVSCVPSDVPPVICSWGINA